MIIPKLSTQRLSLIPLGLEFLSENYLSWMRDEHVFEFMESGDKNYTLEMLKEYLENIERENICSWAIVINENKSQIT